MPPMRRTPWKKKMTKRSPKTSLTTLSARFRRENEPKPNPPYDRTNPPGAPFQTKRTHAVVVLTIITAIPIRPGSEVPPVATPPGGLPSSPTKTACPKRAPTSSGTEPHSLTGHVVEIEDGIQIVERWSLAEQAMCTARCKRCGGPIVWGEVTETLGTVEGTRKWMPLDPDTSPHACGTTRLYTRPVPTNPWVSQCHLDTIR